MKEVEDTEEEEGKEEEQEEELSYCKEPRRVVVLPGRPVCCGARYEGRCC